jgi:hypothetical protein
LRVRQLPLKNFFPPLEPVERFGLARPESFRVGLGLGVHPLVFVHALDVRPRDEVGVRREEAGFVQDGFDGD